ncbi:hypothetical protein [Streptomyces litchfieldiae]|uniref:DUF8017 domain-containing protein n=1 Tax=Streptomyces litchfieldiae TaxID=3075543 RepID=A0ABU2MQF8_9ACTN|nr:hypothetical protein [Streptomyces sp. DSM 44938]MDT0343867.1 hypothetical protein [Streptomyces sp. DSM 44938]
MRPGEQQPGGDPSSQWSNPYQQPGYQQQNPYQTQGQPGQWQQPQQGTGQWQQPGPAAVPTDGRGLPLTGSSGSGNGGRGKTAIAVVLATAVVAAAVITGVVVFTGDDGNEETSAGDSPAPSEEPTEEESAEEGATGGSDPDDPRQGVLQRPDPVVAPDWQVQAIENRHNAFDVPPETWTIGSEGTWVGYEDTTNDDEEGGENPFGDPLVTMSAPAVYMDGWCPESETGASWRAVAGTKGGQGATGTEEAVRGEAGSWALAAYDQEEQGTLEVSEAEPFESDYGIVGHTATATITGVPDNPDHECGTWDGKVVAVSYLDLNNDLATWVLVMDTGFEGELDDETVQQIMNSLRPYPEGGSTE